MQAAPGQLRASVSRHYRPGREVLAGLGQVKAGNARKNCVGSAPARGCDRIGANSKSQEAWPEVDTWAMRYSPGQNRGGTPIGVRLLLKARPCQQHGRLATASVGVPFPFFFAAWRSERGAEVKAGTTPSFPLNAAVLRISPWRQIAKLGRPCGTGTRPLITSYPGSAGEFRPKCIAKWPPKPHSTTTLPRLSSELALILTSAYCVGFPLGRE